VGLHHITWRATASAVTHTSVVEALLSHLIGDTEAVRVEQTTSYHGAPMVLVTAHTKKKSEAMKSFAQLDVATLNQLRNEASLRIDEENSIHFRLDLDQAIGGKFNLATEESNAVIKGQAKIEVYPGQDVLTECDTVLDHAISIAIQRENGETE